MRSWASLPFGDLDLDFVLGGGRLFAGICLIFVRREVEALGSCVLSRYLCIVSVRARLSDCRVDLMPLHIVYSRAGTDG